MVFISQITGYFILTLSLLLTPADKKDLQIELIRPDLVKVEVLTAHPVERGFIIYKGIGVEKKELYKIYAKNKDSLVFNVYSKSFKTLETVDLSFIKKTISKDQRYIFLKYYNKDQIKSINVDIRPDKNCLYIFISDDNYKQKVIVRIKGNYANYAIPERLINIIDKKCSVECKKMNLEFRLAHDQFQQGLQKKIIDNKVLFLHKDVLLSGKHVKEIYLRRNEHGGLNIVINFNEEGSKIFFNITKKNKGKKLAVIVKNKLLIAPVIMMPIRNGKVDITAGYTVKNAREIINNICNEE